MGRKEKESVKSSILMGDNQAKRNPRTPIQLI